MLIDQLPPDSCAATLFQSATVTTSASAPPPPGAGAADAGRAKVLRSHSYSPDEVYIWINRTPSGLRYSARFPRESPLRELGVAASANTPGAQHEGNVTFPAAEARSEDGWAIDPTGGPVHAYLRAFAELVRRLGDASTFSPAL